jgi:glutamate dehydrogenase
MTHRVKESRTDIILKVIKHIHDKLPEKEAKLLEVFVENYFQSASPEDLASRSVLDLYGAVLSHWNFLNLRKPGEFKVRVYNPQFEQHGWQSTHTVIEISVDDMPFLVDSLRMELDKHNLNIHFILHMGGIKFVRHADGHVLQILPSDKSNAEIKSEAVIFFEIDRQSDEAVLQSIKEGLLNVLKDVAKATRDWRAMQSKMDHAIKLVEKNEVKLQKSEYEEQIEFLKWVNDNHFTYLGYCELKLISNETDVEWVMVEHSGLGVLSNKPPKVIRRLSEIPPRAQELARSREPIFLGKTNTIATMHRPVFSDSISVKIFNEKGEVIGEHRFIGLYTSAAYNRSPDHIPWMRQKVKNILKRANIVGDSHDGKTVLNILHSAIPRDDFLQGDENDLYEISMGIFHLQERQKIRLFVREDLFGRFISCLVYVPRDKFNSELRSRMQAILEKEFNGSESSFITRFSESVLARIHFIVRFNEQRRELIYDIDAIEQKLVDAARTWQEDLRTALVDHCGEESGNRLFDEYGASFPISYQEDFNVRTAVFDIIHMETLASDKPLAMSFYRPLEATEGVFRFKLFGAKKALALSDVIPMLEFMGLKVISERPHLINQKSGTQIWLNDFSLVHSAGTELNAVALKEVFQETFYNVWMGLAESDGFNRLVLGAGLNWREIAMLRAYSKYMWQIGFTFSQSYVENALANQPGITRELVELFKLRFDPSLPQDSQNTRTIPLRRKIKQDLEEVANLDEDRILRRYVDVILGTIRTNYYQLDNAGLSKSYISFKLDPQSIPDMPLPKPLFEIFVYSPRVEGVHLRGAKVARGGIRWSDRKEDYRTEVLGLMKAQQVKNAVIVPLGAKGGFVPKMLPEGNDREAIMKEVVACYQTFMRGLLDITDNLKGNEVILPKQVVRYDGDDPYLVVAADKGTATFSDIANALSQEYHFWLDDAFASGGSSGYDHKKMGITAKGAWESVKRHFSEMGVDVQKQEITVVGVGDMSGDVFGNGMLLSHHLKVIAAFDHRHIFLDPNPDPQKSFEERSRLFNLPRSSWDDYDKKLISKGGGVYPRSAKYIDLSPEVQEKIGIKRDRMVPTELIRAILKAPVDLLWNGGIGTYVKSVDEHNSEVGDRTNDSVRINGNEIRAKVVAEGGNLGFTQLGRKEYALNGGRNNTDAIDNSAGVDCSDHEVNIKILLNGVVSSGDMTLKQRNELLAEMTDEVADLVLMNNIRQTAILSMAAASSADNIDMHKRLIQYLEANANLNRSLEFLPSDEDLNARKQSRKGVTRPGLAVLLAYSKTHLKQALLASDLPEDPYVARSLLLPFPNALRQKYSEQMKQHRLKREIICMQVVNDVFYEMGLGFINRIQDETGAHPDEIVRAYIVANEVFKGTQLREAIQSLDLMIDHQTQVTMFLEVVRLLRRATRWFIRQRRGKLDIEKTILHFRPRVQKVGDEIRKYLRGGAEENLEIFAKELLDTGVPEDFAYRIASLSSLFASLDIVEAATQHNFEMDKVIDTYYTLGQKIEISWFREAIRTHQVSNHWDALARAAFRDDLDWQQRSLTVSVLEAKNGSEEVEAKLKLWFKQNKVLINRWKSMVAELKAAQVTEMIMYGVALRELTDLAQASKVHPVHQNGHA